MTGGGLWLGLRQTADTRNDQIRFGGLGGFVPVGIS